MEIYQLLAKAQESAETHKEGHTMHDRVRMLTIKQRSWEPLKILECMYIRLRVYEEFK